MTYPDNYEQKIGFKEIRQRLKELCLSTLGKERADEMAFASDATTIRQQMDEMRQLRQLMEQMDDLALVNFFDVRAAVARARIGNTHLEEDEFFDLRRSLDTIQKIVKAFKPEIDEADDSPDDARGDGAAAESTSGINAFNRYPHPALAEMADGIATFPTLVKRIDQIIDKFGHIRSTASPELQRIRRELERTEGSISRTLYGILHAAQSEGVVDKDVTPTLRDGRLVIPVAPALKRRIHGIVHDESASGRTVFIEPTEVVEANNRIRELESDERHEIIRILTELTTHVRPHVGEILDSFRFLAAVDFLQAKVALGKAFKAIEPQVEDHPVIDWIRAVHPLLQHSLEKQQKNVVPLDITLTPEKHILIISGPNAGGKSVCLKTVGLLQYMLQCGLPIPVRENSRVGVFNNIMIDIGDEQSLENDLSTYSSHLLNMKNMMRAGNDRTLILIDEFGTGTEPLIGGAIAEAVLSRFVDEGCWAVITTHYQNLKHFADSHPGVANGAMLYDRHEMRPLFQLSIGRPGSSFAIEIARKIGLPESVIQQASDIVGNDYIQSDKYLQDIVRDKRYWENKRQSIHQREKDLEKTIAQYADDMEALERQRKEIIASAKHQAQEMLAESNKRIENAIREIREQQAEKEETKKIRQQLKEYEDSLADADRKANDEKLARKMEKIKQRKERHAKHQQEKNERERQSAEALRKAATKRKDNDGELQKGDHVNIKGLTSIGQIESIDGKSATVIFGDMRTKVDVKRLEKSSSQLPSNSSHPSPTTPHSSLLTTNFSRTTQDTIDAHRNNFHQDLDVRGMRGDEALVAVEHFIDDAILVGMPRVRILHGKGNGILRQLIRQYLSTVPNVSHFADENVQFGGAGITVVDL